MRLMRRLISVSIFSFIIHHSSFIIPSYAAPTAADTWGQVTKSIAINPGTTVSVWKDASRSLVTNGSVLMDTVGDGTFEYVVGLNRGQYYNYLFYANAGFPAVGRLQAWNEYYDIVPVAGKIRCSSNGRTVDLPDTIAYYGSVSYDARRILYVPGYYPLGDTIYVFNNFGETPGIVQGVDAAAEGDTMIRLTWTSVYGSWGTGGEAMKAADVLAGGYYEIYRATDSAGPYSKIANVDGSQITYLDTDKLGGTTYYYCMRAVDAYSGTLLTDSFIGLRGDTSLVDSAQPRAWIRTFFLVKGADWNVIEEHDRIVWLSRPNDPPWAEKVPARIVRIYLPRKEEN